MRKLIIVICILCLIGILLYHYKNDSAVLSEPQGDTWGDDIEKDPTSRNERIAKSEIEKMKKSIEYAIEKNRFSATYNCNGEDSIEVDKIVVKYFKEKGFTVDCLTSFNDKIVNTLGCGYCHILW